MPTLILSISEVSPYLDRVNSLLDSVLPTNYEILTLNKSTQLSQVTASLHESTLINFDNNIIIPKSMLESMNFRCFNFHTATPDFPGRDAHHFALYYQAKYHGATFHRMNVTVDSGHIFDVRSFPILTDESAEDIHNKSLECAYELLVSHISSILKPDQLKLSTDWVWDCSKPKGTRKLMLELCDLTNISDDNEFHLRIKAFSHSKYSNLFLRRNGYVFYIA